MRRRCALPPPPTGTCQALTLPRPRPWDERACRVSASLMTLIDPQPRRAQPTPGTHRPAPSSAPQPPTPPAGALAPQGGRRARRQVHDQLPGQRVLQRQGGAAARAVHRRAAQRLIIGPPPHHDVQGRAQPGERRVPARGQDREDGVPGQPADARGRLRARCRGRRGGVAVLATSTTDWGDVGGGDPCMTLCGCRACC